MKDNQHYITKAYLDKFTHPESKHNVLYPYSRTQGSRKPTGTRNLGSAERFYEIYDGNGPINKLDEERKLIESALFASGKNSAGALAKAVYEQGFVPTPRERHELGRVAAFLRCGSPVQIHNTSMMCLMAHQVYLFNQMNSDLAKDLYRTKYGEQAEEKLQDDREALLQGTLCVDVKDEQQKQLGFFSYQSEELITNTLHEMKLTICTSHYTSFFLTSDNPVVMTSRTQPKSPGLRLKDTEIWLPVSYRKGLLWRWGNGGIDNDTFGASQTRSMNRRVIQWSYNHVYSPLRQEWIADAVASNVFNPCYGHYGTLQRFLDDHAAPMLVDSPSGPRLGEVVDLLAGLRSGAKLDILKLK